MKLKIKNFKISLKAKSLIYSYCTKKVKDFPNSNKILF